MALGTLTATVTKSTVDQKCQIIFGTLQVSGFNDTYPAGGFPLDSVLKQLEAVKSTSGVPLRVLINSGAGSGYIYQRITATGTMMILQVPLSGSLTTAAPLQQLSSAAGSLSGPYEDTIEFIAWYLKV